jgi:hypothetical protein
MGDSTRSNDQSSGRSNPGMQQNSNLQSAKQDIAGNKQSTGQQGGRTSNMVASMHLAAPRRWTT